MAIKEIEIKYCIASIKVAIIISGMVTLGTGVYSHFNSSYRNQAIPNKIVHVTQNGTINLLNNDTKLTYPEICKLHNFYITSGLVSSDIACPEIGKEILFVSVIISTFVASLITLLLIYTPIVSVDWFYWQVFDVIFHGIIGLILLAAGILYIESAIKIEKFTNSEDDNKEFLSGLLTGEKVAAGVCAIVQSALYGIVCGLISWRIIIISFNSS